MSKIDDGGQAFPRAGYDGPDNHSEGVLGMSLRDYFAAQAINSELLATLVFVKCAEVERRGLPEIKITPQTMAFHAYELADAMIAQSKGSSS